MAGFFGLEWTNNATIEVIIEAPGFNNSLAGGKACNNSHSYRNAGGKNATAEWVGIYLKDATKRLQPLLKGYELTVDDVYAMQTLCPYETVSHFLDESRPLAHDLKVAYGYSVFCDLFTYEEWIHFGYSLDIYFAGSSSFQVRLSLLPSLLHD